MHCVVVGLGLCMAQVDCLEGTCTDGRTSPAKLRVDKPVRPGLGWSLTLLAADDDEGRMVAG